MKASRPKAGGPVAIERSIKKHIALAENYVAEGFDSVTASKKAFVDIMDEKDRAAREKLGRAK